MPGRGRVGPRHRLRRPARLRAREHRRYRPAGRCRRAVRHGARPWSTRASRRRSSSTARHVGIDVGIVERNPDDKGFVPQAKRWIVEQTNGILMFYRRLVRDYEHRPASSRSRVFWAMTSVMARRLTGSHHRLLADRMSENPQISSRPGARRRSRARTGRPGRAVESPHRRTHPAARRDSTRRARTCGSPARPSSRSPRPHPPPGRTAPTSRTTPPTSRSSPPWPTRAGRCAPATSARPSTCRSSRRTPKASAPN